MLHRRDKFRAQQDHGRPRARAPQDRDPPEHGRRRGPRRGEGRRAAAARHRRPASRPTMPIEGLFIAIGYKPNTEAFRDWLEVDAKGYLVVRDETGSQDRGRVHRRRRPRPPLPPGGDCRGRRLQGGHRRRALARVAGHHRGRDRHGLVGGPRRRRCAASCRALGHRAARRHACVRAALDEAIAGGRGERAAAVRSRPSTPAAGGVSAPARVPPTDRAARRRRHPRSRPRRSPTSTTFALVDVCADADGVPSPGSFDDRPVDASRSSISPTPRAAHAPTSVAGSAPGGSLVVTTVNRRHPVRGRAYLGAARRPAPARSSRWSRPPPADAHPLVGACNDPATIRAALVAAGVHRCPACGRSGTSPGPGAGTWPTFALGLVGDLLAQPFPSRRSTIASSRGPRAAMAFPVGGPARRAGGVSSWRRRSAAEAGMLGSGPSPTSARPARSAAARRSAGSSRSSGRTGSQVAVVLGAILVDELPRADQPDPAQAPDRRRDPAADFGLLNLFVGLMIVAADHHRADRRRPVLPQQRHRPERHAGPARRALRAPPADAAALLHRDADRRDPEPARERRRRRPGGRHRHRELASRATSRSRSARSSRCSSSTGG